MIELETDAIIWDLDGTLIDSMELSWEVIKDVFPRNGWPEPTFEDLSKNFHGALEETIASLIGSDDSVVIEGLIADFLKTQDKLYGNTDNIFLPDAVHLAQRAHKQGIWQFLVTNRAHGDRGTASPKALVAGSELSKMISYIICGDEVTFRKPDVRVLDSVTAERELPNKCLVIGDQFVDAKLAQNLGAAAVLVERHGPVPHLNELQNWQSWVHIVPTLDDVQLVSAKK